jgi:starch phosphorylase
MSMARRLYWGCDVWLNNPLRPYEACGTSGMKSALNGGLNLSIRDGWWDEWYDGENGWDIPSSDGVADANRRDDLEAGALYDLLEQSVAPKFYDRDDHGVPPRWIEMVRHTLQTLGPKVLASRMVRDYTERYYTPAAQSLRRTVGDERAGGHPDYRPARELAAYRRRALQAWPKIRITDVDSTGLPDTPVLGSKLTLTATVQLAGLRPEEVAVQAVLGRVDAGDALRDPTIVEMLHTDTVAGGEVFSMTTLLPVAGAVGYTVRVLPNHPLLTAANELGLVTLA